jgi:hypothetical protein
VTVLIVLSGPPVRRLDAARLAEELVRTVLAEVASRSSAGGAA